MSSEKNWLHTTSLKQVRSSNEVCIWYQLLGTSGSILHPDAHSIGLSHLQVVKNGRLPEIEICEVATTSFQEKRGKVFKNVPLHIVMVMSCVYPYVPLTFTRAA